MPNRFGFRYWLLLAAVSFWLILIVLPAVTGWLNWELSQWLYLPFALVCHQSAERSWFWLGQQLAVCHRCLGIYMGVWFAALLAPRLERPFLRLAQPPWRLLLFFVPLGLDALLLPNTPVSRFVTGLVAGLPIALLLWLALHGIRLSLETRRVR